MNGISPPRGVSEGVLLPLRRGFSVDVVDRALEDGKLSLSELDRLVLPRKTLSHRRILGSLTPDQSDRLSRVLRIIDDANETFGDAVKAHTWLRRPISCWMAKRRSIGSTPILARVRSKPFWVGSRTGWPSDGFMAALPPPAR